MKFSYDVVLCFVLLAAMVAASRTHAGGPSICCASDLDGPRAVDTTDLAIVLGAWTN